MCRLLPQEVGVPLQPAGPFVSTVHVSWLLPRATEHIDCYDGAQKDTEPGEVSIFFFTDFTLAFKNMHHVLHAAVSKGIDLVRIRA